MRFCDRRTRRSLAGKHLEFEPRLAEARWLAENFSIHAMIDLRTGGRPAHILKASRGRCGIAADGNPQSIARKITGERTFGQAKPAFVAALTMAKDFELLFTVAGADAVKLLDAWKIQFPKLTLTASGKLSGAKVLRSATKRRPTAHGRCYDHILIVPPRTESLGASAGSCGKARAGHRPVRRFGRGKTQLVKGTARGWA